MPLLQADEVPIHREHARLLSLMDQACFEESLCWSKSLFESVLETGAWGAILRLAEIPVGFHLCRSAAGETEILTLGILPPFRRKGLSSVLMANIFDGAKSRKAEDIFLEVEESNLVARQLYLRSGFRILGRRPGYYGSGRDALVMGISPLNN